MLFFIQIRKKIDLIVNICTFSSLMCAMTDINYTQPFPQEMYNNVTTFADASNNVDVMRILQISVSSVGMAANAIVVFAFLNHKQLRSKVPNMYIINQVSHLYVFFSLGVLV